MRTRTRLTLVPLEDRAVPATLYTVTGAGDDNTRDAVLTLREALLAQRDGLALSPEEQALAPNVSTLAVDTITFAPALAGQTITFAASDTSSLNRYGPTGFVVTTAVAIDGTAGAGRVTLSGGGTRRLFAVTEAGGLALANLTLTGGAARGGSGGGGGAGLGGAVFVDRGALTILNSTLAGNRAAGGNGGGGIGGGGGWRAVARTGGAAARTARPWAGRSTTPASPQQFRATSAAIDRTSRRVSAGAGLRPRHSERAVSVGAGRPVRSPVRASPLDPAPAVRPRQGAWSACPGAPGGSATGAGAGPRGATAATTRHRQVPEGKVGSAAAPAPAGRSDGARSPRPTGAAGAGAVSAARCSATRAP